MLDMLHELDGCTAERLVRETLHLLAIRALQHLPASDWLWMRERAIRRGRSSASAAPRAAGARR